MANYVDTQELESDWFHWVIAKSVPALEIYREQNNLWTRVDTKSGKRGLEYPDPYAPTREHCLVTNTGVLKFSSNGGMVDPTIIHQKGSAHKPPATAYVKYIGDIPERFIKERTLVQSWNDLTQKIWLICSGVADYHLSSSNELYDLREDMVNETAAQIFTKLTNDKLKYSPGQAPVFNLLSTAIHNLCYTFLAKESRRLANKQKLIHEAWNGQIRLPTIRDMSLV